MYQALYRKYRPQKFDDVYGQEHITETLKNQLKSGRIFHAYLFTGSRGTGKTTCAKILAKAACCPNLRDGEPCGECDVCRGVDDGSLLDVLEIDAASNNGVDDIRDLREKAVYSPNTAKYRVYIIDEVHMLSSGAFNALLKTLEEPPTHVIFILATTEVHKLPATILSRCQRFDFRRITPELISKRLKYVCKQEKLEITDDAATLIASLADGGLRDALSILDLCAGTEGKITEHTVSDICGMAGREYLFSLAGFLEERDTASALELIGKLHSASVDITRLCEEIVSHLRNLMLVKTLKNPSGLVVCSSGEMEELKESAAKWRLDSIIYALQVFEDTLSKMGRGNRRTGLEMAVVRLCSPELNSSPDAVLTRLAAVERSIKTGLPPERSHSPQIVEKPAPVKKAEVKIPAEETAKPSVDDLPPWEEPVKTPSPEKIDDLPPAPAEKAAEVTDVASPQEDKSAEMPDGAFDKWNEILAIIARTCPLMHGVLQGSSAYEKGDILLIDCANSQFRDLVNNENPLYKDSIRNAALEITGKRYRLGPYVKKAEAEKSDPLDDLIKKAASLGL